MDKKPPEISASFTISPATHPYADSKAPSLHLTITSHHPHPITVYADDLAPTLMLTCGVFIITELTTGSTVKQRRSTHCRIPPSSKVAVPLHEHLFHTHLPHTLLTLSAPSIRRRPNTGDQPLAKNDPRYADDRSAKHRACGVDGLEPGTHVFPEPCQ